jgi:hypothetical protein
VVDLFGLGDLDPQLERQAALLSGFPDVLLDRPLGEHRLAEVREAPDWQSLM